jgi:hypothetical protein
VASAAGPHALGAAAFAGMPALEWLDLSAVRLGDAGATMLASRRWSRLKQLDLSYTRIGDDGVAALARGAWPALERLVVERSGLGTPPAFEDVRCWAPNLAQLIRMLPRSVAIFAKISGHSGVKQSQIG